jgi:hypothetical protein
MKRILCAHCGRSVVANPRVKNQRYCNGPACQRARKALWQRQKIYEDPDYKANQRDCWKQWQKRHPDYWRIYRLSHPLYQKRNRLLQRVRNTNRGLLPKVQIDTIAKMDALTSCYSYKPGLYYLIPPIAKMDSIPQKAFIIPTGYP